MCLHPYLILGFETSEKQQSKKTEPGLKGSLNLKKTDLTSLLWAGHKEASLVSHPESPANRASSSHGSDGPLL